jgi:hypothetical protein
MSIFYPAQFSHIPDPTQLSCSFIVTNIPLGAYLLRLGAHFEPGWVRLGAYFMGNKLVGLAAGLPMF